MVDGVHEGFCGCEELDVGEGEVDEDACEHGEGEGPVFDEGDYFHVVSVVAAICRKPTASCAAGYG